MILSGVLSWGWYSLYLMYCMHIRFIILYLQHWLREEAKLKKQEKDWEFYSYYHRKKKHKYPDILTGHRWNLCKSWEINPDVCNFHPDLKLWNFLRNILVKLGFRGVPGSDRIQLIFTARLAGQNQTIGYLIPYRHHAIYTYI